MPEPTPQPPMPPMPIPKRYDERRVKRDFWPKVKRVAAKVPGASDLAALFFYMNSKRASLQHKLSILATLAYFIMPFDIIPDWLGVIGYTDDMAAAAGLIAFIGSEIMKPYRDYAKRWLRGEAPAIEGDPDEAIEKAAAKTIDVRIESKPSESPK